MKSLFFALGVAALAANCTATNAQSMRLTTDVPECRTPGGTVLPERYQTLAKKHKEFAWVKKLAPGDRRISHQGWERVDGSAMYNWFDFFLVDLNNDGYCDWYVNASAPLSTGGDRDTINTLYLGQKNRWVRIGAHIPEDKPDQLGAGDADDEQSGYLFGEEISTVYDAAAKTSYFITGFYDRNVQRDDHPGYRVMTWDNDKKTLRLLDKWQPGSKAAEVYAFFKAHGAWTPSGKMGTAKDTIQRFDPQVEAVELEQACDRGGEGLSPYLLKRCKR
ncbi:hypothetical protein HAV22_12725 [Massilia sp. TW-1]|uniref:Uncharacterized protein n=1 Tax=Telluria antibiotica TaxID=2717319 RepID=A0ABX0PB19_9BURK|nr:hypothetical protein [Telluria antibiotica]NIA54499.1 hypothetical protein [Telluria antibiotica]